MDYTKVLEYIAYSEAHSNKDVTPQMQKTRIAPIQTGTSLPTPTKPDYMIPKDSSRTQTNGMRNSEILYSFK